MILKTYNQFIMFHEMKLNESISEDSFTFKFKQKCPDCEGTGVNSTSQCSHCSGAGFSNQWEYDEETGIEMDHDVDCEHCDGTGEIESDCDTCNETGFLIWNLEFVKEKGVINMYEDYGNSDYPLLYDDGDVRWDHPNIFPTEIRDITRFIMHNKDLSVKDMANKLVRYMIEEEYFKEFKISDDMMDLLDDDTNRILQSTAAINKFSL